METRRVPLAQEEAILHCPFPGLRLPKGDLLTLNSTKGILSCFSCGHNHVTMTAQEYCTYTEILILFPLLKCFPHGCSYEQLYASFYKNPRMRWPLDERVLASSRETLLAHERAGTLSKEMRPIANAITRARSKLRPFGLQIKRVGSDAYRLTVAPSVAPLARVS